ncbi:hypothetical protein [Sphingomonas pituitosa]|uniref:hypothetical protein n=1 Tax=Sphingomonas pituitosa TaxID=99597 RepID=UPI0012EDF268|nr:hypothetical protein [Sphingomonas pituitosa]
MIELREIVAGQPGIEQALDNREPALPCLALDGDRSDVCRRQRQRRARGCDRRWRGSIVRVCAEADPAAS